MRNFKIRKNETRTRIVMPEVLAPLPKPRFPLVVFWEAHELKNIYMGWDAQSINEPSAVQQKHLSPSS